MQRSHHPDIQAHKLEKTQKNEITALYNALFESLTGVKGKLQGQFNPEHCEIYKTIFKDTKVSIEAYQKQAAAYGLGVTELDNAINSMNALYQPSGQSIAKLDTYIQHHIIDPVWNFQYHQVEHPGQKPLSIEQTTFPIAELPKDIANYVTALASQPAITVHLSRVNRPFYGLFQPEIGKHEAKETAECAIYPTQENVEQLKIWLKECPSLVLHPVIVKNRHGMVIKGTIYQIALHEGDNELIDDVIKPAFERLPNVLETMEAQRKTWLPDGWMETEEKTCENACKAIDDVFTAFNKASDPDDVTELQQHPFTITINNQEANQALDVFREAIATLYQATGKAIESGRDPIIRLIERVIDRCKENYDALGGYNTPRNNALMRAVYGYCQRFAPINFMQAFAMGIYHIVENKEKLIRSFEYRNWKGHYILPLDSDPIFRLGYEYFAGGIGVWKRYAQGRGLGRRGYTKLFVNQKQLQLYSPALCSPGNGIAQ